MKLGLVPSVYHSKDTFLSLNKVTVYIVRCEENLE